MFSVLTEMFLCLTTCTFDMSYNGKFYGSSVWVSTREFVMNIGDAFVACSVIML